MGNKIRKPKSKHDSSDDDPDIESYSGSLSDSASSDLSGYGLYH